MSNVTGVLRGILDQSTKPLRVIEIGTSYGNQLPLLEGCVNLLEMVSIDPMYDWVPDLKPGDSFDPKKVDQRKLDTWHENKGKLPVQLIISKSHDAALENKLPHSQFDVLLIDGCHHPAQAVADDYWDFISYLMPEHVVIFDDIDHGDPDVASRSVINDLQAMKIDVKSEDHCGGKVRVLRISVPNI